MNKVYVERNHSDYIKMFQKYKWEVVDCPSKADLIQFIGGADINPALYGRLAHPETFFSTVIDDKTLQLYEYAQENNIRCAGICRGSQFLHAMAGGELVQHCNNHAVHAGHLAKVRWLPNTQIHVSSTHHQMMYSEDVGEVLMYADNIADYKETVTSDGNIESLPIDIDIEAMYYEKINAISFQPHPEFVIHDDSYKECADAYFFILNNYLNFRDNNGNVKKENNKCVV